MTSAECTPGNMFTARNSLYVLITHSLETCLFTPDDNHTSRAFRLGFPLFFHSSQQLEDSGLYVIKLEISFVPEKQGNILLYADERVSYGAIRPKRCGKSSCPCHALNLSSCISYQRTIHLGLMQKCIIYDSNVKKKISP